MKKSEMLNLMSQTIHQTRRATEVWTSDEIALKLLDLIEDEGMFPPDSYIWHIHGLPEICYAWESEDET